MWVAKQPGCWLRSSHSLQRVRISSLVSDSARKFNGAKMHNRKLGMKLMGRGASNKGRSHSGSGGGHYTSENAGMSSANYVRIIMAESLRF